MSTAIQETLERARVLLGTLVEAEARLKPRPILRRDNVGAGRSRVRLNSGFGREARSYVAGEAFGGERPQASQHKTVRVVRWRLAQT